MRVCDLWDELFWKNLSCKLFSFSKCVTKRIQENSAQIDTEVMKFRINKILSSRFVQWLLFKFIRIYSLTLRFEVQNEDAWLVEYLHNNGRIILCAHHQQFFSAIRYFQKYKKYKPGIMISRSNDGEFISAVANRTGWITVRGSPSKGGDKGLNSMIDHLTEHRLAGHIIDGPRRPFGIVKPGVIRMLMAFPGNC
jgi:lysophospholipid acyltransferase (LPLAT)-like uncharacterized protein